MKDFHIQWHVTNRCNLRCLHCYQDTFKDRDELKWRNLKKICDNLIESMKAKNKKLTISLTGGEPFLKEEIFDIIGYLSLSGYVSNLSIITNGILIDKFITKLTSFSKLRTLFVSLEAVTPGINDSIRGKGSFEKVLQNIRILKENGFSVFIMFTVLRRNLKEAEKLMDFSRTNCLDGFILERFVPLGQSKKIKEELVSRDELENLYKAIFKQCQIEFFREAIQYHALKVDFRKEQADLFGAECVVAKYGCALMPDGCVLPCRRFNLPIGSLLNNSLWDILDNSEVLGKVKKRESLKGSCRLCKVSGCLGCRALAYALTEDYLAQDPLCWMNDVSKLCL